MKLRKLILSGFKSFADKTEFEFDEGISCVVGPNGCGKSNIVDAIKWVLGEQSAKSLRGSEMMDVIFNGSSARRASGSAEVILVFDNTSGVLNPQAIDEGLADAAATEVSVGRRLYRNGQSEYVINGTVCRLKDIRELFMDTGIGHDAYALIEQGRVEAFLQASQDDRRAIFDEAAGISKYKARKKESLRKLERVEQNLLRLDDILGEVDKRLRSIKYQAGKARNYQEHSQRLKELRSLHFLAQYHGMQQTRETLQKRLDDENASLALAAKRIEQLEAAGSGAEYEAADLERTATDLQSRLATTAAQINSARERRTLLGEKARELRDQIAAACQRCEGLELKRDQYQSEQTARRADVETVEDEIQQLADRVQQASAAFHSGEMDVTHLTARLEDEKAGTIDLLRRTAQLHNDISASGIRRENLHSRRQALCDRAQRVTDELADLLIRRGQAHAKFTDVEEVLVASQQRLDETKQAEADLSGSETALRNELAEARENRSAAAGRVEALRDMLKRLEGVGTGVRRVLKAKQEGRLPAVRGMLGQFLQSDVEHAAIVEAALAGADQYLLMDSFEDLQDAREELDQVVADGGSVEFLCKDRMGPWRWDLPANRTPGAVRVMDHVRCDSAVAPVVWRLLGRTLVVDSLSTASSAAADLPGSWRFVTPAGDVLEPDGRVRVGATRVAGVIAQRSELALLQQTIDQLSDRIETLRQQWQHAHDQRQHMEQLAQSLRTAIYEASTERVESEGRLAQLDQQIAQLQQEQPVITGDLADIAAEIDRAVQQEHQAKQKATELEERNAERQREVEDLQRQIAEAQQQRDARANELTELKVSQAAAQQKRVTAGEALAALLRHADQIRQDLAATQSQIGLSRQRLTDTDQSVTAAGQEIDRLGAQQEQLTVDVKQVEQSRTSLTERIQEIRTQLTQQRQDHDAAVQRVNAVRVEIATNDTHVEDLITRASDEMNMDLMTLRDAYEHDEDRDWDAVESEINDLKGKIERLGNVNLDAIDEQAELEQRREFLQGQLGDVRTSQKQIEDLIDRLNTESHDRFLETFEAVRVNFQELFRKLFGGGKADIVLTMPEDVLESGIEIVARPPGKELRSLSLLSGGEKTMTALGLMFSMFKHRPTPFCLLDEVDAALDEANTERFSRLVHEFVRHSQFIVISHAKRTMSMASVLYGVTMQEPGVSRRISVKFEDVGHKLDAQLEPVAAG